jgi:type IV pilus assembly protein PilB
MGYNIETFQKGVGCRRCRNTGFSGRIGVHELVIITDELRDVIVNSPSLAAIRQAAVRGGMITLRQDGFRKVREGITTIEEILHVAGEVQEGPDAAAAN